MYLPGERLDFLFRGLEVLGLGPDPGPLQISFQNFENNHQIFSPAGSARPVALPLGFCSGT
jgi:hypothetical protein